MPDSETENRGGLVFLVVLSSILLVVAVVSLTLSPASATTGGTVSAFVLLAGAGYGLVASVVSLARRRGVDTGESGTAESDRAAK